METKLIEERLEFLAGELNNTKAGSDEAKKIKDEILDLWKMLLEDERVVNERMDRNRRYDLDEMKFESERRESKRKDNAAYADCITRILEKILMIGGAAALLIVTFALESEHLIPAKTWGFVTKLLKF